MVLSHCFLWVDLIVYFIQCYSDFEKCWNYRILFIHSAYVLDELYIKYSILYYCFWTVQEVSFVRFMEWLWYFYINSTSLLDSSLQGSRSRCVWGMYLCEICMTCRFNDQLKCRILYLFHGKKQYSLVNFV